MNTQHSPRTLWKRLLFFMVGIAVITLIGRISDAVKPVRNTAGQMTITHDAEFALGDTVHQMVISGYYLGQPFQKTVRYTIVEGVALIEGDILIDANVTQAGMGLSEARYGRLWPDGLVPYVIDEKLPLQERIHDAIAHWEETTSIRFVERTTANASQYPNYVRFQPSFGCSSYVGMVGGGQPINLALGCSTGNTIHEIGHAIGLWHEQSRHDRDEYVRINYDNIMPAYAFNFDKQVADGQDIGEYDYGSIMHYPRWAFSKNGEDTITPLRDGVEIGQRDTLSEGDIAAVEYMYQEQR